jgi:competence protein ComEA
MYKNIVKSVFALVLGCACATGSLAQEEAAPAPKAPSSQAAQDKQDQDAKAKQDQDAKAKRLERKRAVQAANAAKAKAAKEKQREQAKARAEAEAKAVDLNRASKADLKKLPGMTDAYADAIIAKRPYKTKAELVTKNVLPMGVYQGLHDQVAAKYVPTK